MFKKINKKRIQIDENNLDSVWLYNCLLNQTIF
jgi:hypothetical protein